MSDERYFLDELTETTELSDNDLFHIGKEEGVDRKITKAALEEQLNINSGSGLPNYLDMDIDKWTVETGWVLTEETEVPLNSNGTINAAVASGVEAGVSFSRDIVVNEIDLSSKLQTSFYFKNKSGMDFSLIDIEIIDLDNDNFVLFSSGLLDYADYNAASEIYFFDAIFNTSGNSNYRVKFKTNSETLLAGEMLISNLSLGYPFYFTTVDKGLNAGATHTSSEAPNDNGLNSDGELCANGSTFNWADYPDLSIEKNGDVLIDNEDGTFTTKNLSSVIIGWRTIFDTIDGEDTRTTEFDINDYGDGFYRGLHTTSSSGSGLLTFNITIKDNIYANYGRLFGSTVDISDRMYVRSDAYVLNFGEHGDYTGYFAKIEKAIVADYLYIRPTDQRTTQWLKKQTNRADVGECILSAIAPDDNNLGPNGELAFNGSTYNFSNFPEISNNKSVYIDLGIITDNGDGTFTTLKIAETSYGWQTVFDAVDGGDTAAAAVDNIWGEGYFRWQINYAGASSFNSVFNFQAKVHKDNIGYSSSLVLSSTMYMGSDVSTDNVFKYFASDWGAAVFVKIEKAIDVFYPYLRSKSLNQIIAGEIKSAIGTQTISASGDVTVGDTNQLIAFDTSGGNISPDIEDGSFIGQHIDFYTVGDNKAKIGGTGFYTNRVWQTSNTGLCGATWTGSEWRVDNQGTADYEDGIQRIMLRSDGEQEISVSSGESLYGYNLSSSSYKTIIFANAFSETPTILPVGQRDHEDTVTAYVRMGAYSATQFTVAHGAGSSASIYCLWMARGKY